MYPTRCFTRHFLDQLCDLGVQIHTFEFEIDTLFPLVSCKRAFSREE